MKRRTGLLVVLAAALPTSLVLTILTARLWSWFEGATGVEAFGHAGPAGWCFGVVYAFCVAAGCLVLWQAGKSNVPPSRRP